MSCPVLLLSAPVLLSFISFPPSLLAASPSATFAHRDLTSLNSSLLLRTEVLLAEQALKQATCVRPRILRPPFGAVSPLVLAELYSMGYHVRERGRGVVCGHGHVDGGTVVVKPVWSGGTHSICATGVQLLPRCVNGVPDCGLCGCCTSAAHPPVLFFARWWAGTWVSCMSSGSDWQAQAPL